MAIEVKLPGLGDGIESADVLEVLVKEGDRVEKDQGLVEVETDKATVQVPSSAAGIVKKIHVKSGDSIDIGAPIVTLEADAKAESKPAAPEQPAKKAEPPAKEPAAKAPKKEEPAPAKPREEEAPAKSAPAPAAERQPAKAAPAVAKAKPVAEEEEPEETADEAPAAQSEDGQKVIPAGPAVRRFAREVGVDLRRVRGSGPGGRITREDVLEVVRQANLAANGARSAGTAMDQWGPIRVERLTKIRRTIAERMHQSWTNIPRVTNFDDADVTELERIRESSKGDYASKGIKLTSLPFVIKAVAMSLKAHPQINSALDMEHDQLIYKEYVNIGIAVDSERGLVVPALRNVDDLSISEIARNLASIAEKVRRSEFTVDDLRGGTFTISNLGSIGGTYSTPIVNLPEVAILLIGRSRKMPVVIEDQIQPRLMMPLSLSYDHRVVDGATAARFLNEVIAYLETPSRLLLAP